VLPIVRQCEYCEATATDSLLVLDEDMPEFMGLKWVGVCDEHWRMNVTA
jgi:hypothetical protein